MKIIVILFLGLVTFTAGQKDDDIDLAEDEEAEELDELDETETPTNQKQQPRIENRQQVLQCGRQGGSRFRKTSRCQRIPRSCRSIKARYPQALSGVYTIRITRGTLQVYCEMSINRGAYTFLSIEGVAQLRRNDLRHLVRDKKTVLLRISNPDGTQPYTVIQPLKNNGVLSVQLSQHVNYNAPVNRHLGPYLYLGTLPKSEANKKTKQGFRSNGREVSFRNCDGNPNSYFAFIPNPQEKTPSRYHINNPIYEKRGVAVDFRASAKRPPSARRMPLDFFHLTEMHFGGCGCYTSSDRWLNPGTVHPALGTAVGLR